MNEVSKISSHADFAQLLAKLWTNFDWVTKIWLGSEGTVICLKWVSSKTDMQTDGKTQIENAF